MTEITNEDYVRAAFGEHWRQAWVATWSAMGGGFAPARLGSLPANASNYVAVSRLKRGATTRSDETFEAAHLFVLDDVGEPGVSIGSKMDKGTVDAFAPEPNAVIETSPGNFQYHYWLSEPCEDRWLWAAFLDGMKKSRMWQGAADGNGLGRYFRLPVGAASKAGREGFETRLDVWSPEAERYTVRELAELFEIDVCDEAVEAYREEMEGARMRVRQGVTHDGRPDPLMRLFDAAGIVVLDPRPSAGGFIKISCPWFDEHTDGRVEAGYAPGTGAFRCLHSHCASRTTDDLKAYIDENVNDQERGTAVAELFPALEGEILEPGEESAEEAASRIRSEMADRVEERFGSWVYVKEVNRFVEVDTGVMMSKEVFNNVCELSEAGRAGMQAASAMFLNGGGRVVTTLEYLPGGDRFVELDRGGGLKVSAYNKWRPGRALGWQGGAVADEDEAVSRWIAHVQYLFHDPAEAALFMDWCAYVVQKPGGKINWAMVVKGGQGTGKDLCLRPISTILGMHNVSSVTIKDIERDFSEWLEARMIVVEELPRFHKADVYEGLKSKISVAQPRMRVNRKKLEPYTIANIQAWILFTNHADALALEADDRRFAVLDSAAQKQEPEYYKGLADLFGSEGFLNRFHAWLMQRDLSAFDAWSPPEASEAKKDMALLSREPGLAWVEDLFEDGGDMEGRVLVTADEVAALAQAAAATMDMNRDVAKRLNAVGVGRIFLKLGFEKLGQKRLSVGRRVLWARLRAYGYKAMSENHLATKYDEDRDKSKWGDKIK